MSKKINWGILGTAAIAKDQLIPAIKQSENSNLAALASREIEKAKVIAEANNIPKCYGSYNELINDPQIDAVYIPLPNHMHLEYTIKSIQKGKHVLVEKPICLKSADVEELIKVMRDYPQVKVMEAFMYKLHPQWIKVKELIQNGAIGKLKFIQSSFSFFDDNPNSIVNTKEYGGGSLYDIGCYPVSVSRFIFDDEPNLIYANMHRDPKMEIDITANCILEFENGSSQFFSSIRMKDNQNVKIYGTDGIIELKLPFNPALNKPAEIILTKNETNEIIKVDMCNQYELEVSLFSKSIIENIEPPISIQDSLNNMLVIDKIFDSAKIGKKIIL